MIMFIKQQFNKMGEIKQINIKNRTSYFYNIIDIKNFESRLLKIDKKLYKNIGIYNIGQITIKKIDDCENVYSVNPLYSIIAHANGYIEEKGLFTNVWFLTLQMKIKSSLKNAMMFLMELEIKSKKSVVVVRL